MGNKGQLGSTKKMIFVIIAGLLAAHAATFFWGLMTHWTQVNLVFMDLIVGVTVGLFVRRGADSTKPKYAITAVLITLWGVLLGYIFNVTIFAAAELHHSYWLTYKIQGFTHSIELVFQQLTFLDYCSIGAAVVSAAILSVHGKK